MPWAGFRSATRQARTGRRLGYRRARSIDRATKEEGLVHDPPVLEEVRDEDRVAVLRVAPEVVHREGRIGIADRLCAVAPEREERVERRRLVTIGRGEERAVAAAQDVAELARRAG